MRFRFPKFPLKFKEMDQESKAMAGVLVAFAIVVIGAVGLSQGQAGTPSLGPDEKPNMTAKSGGLPSEAIEEEPGEKKQKGKGKGSKDNKSLDKLADSIGSSPSGGAGKSEAPTSTPVASAPKTEEPASSDDSGATETPASKKPTSDKPTSEKPEEARKSQPKPAPSTLTSARVRALKSGATFQEVASELGASLSRAELTSRYGSEPAKGMLAQEPAGRPCRYYALAPGQPAPLVRLCFDANGHLLTREFVAPQG